MDEELQDEEVENNDHGRDLDENNDDEDLASTSYEHLQIEPIAESSSVCIETKPTNPYASIKRPLKTVPKSEIAIPSSSAHSNTLTQSLDYDSSFDHSADDSGAQDSSAHPPAAKKSRASHSQTMLCVRINCD